MRDLQTKKGAAKRGHVQRQSRFAIFGFFFGALAALAWAPSAAAQGTSQWFLPGVIGTRHNSVGNYMQPALKDAELPLFRDTNRSHSDRIVRAFPRKEPNQHLFTGPHRATLPNSVLDLKLLGNNPAVCVEGLVAPSAANHRTNFPAAPATGNEASAARRLPTFYQEDTPFSTQVRLPVAHLLGGRLRFDAFYRESSANNMVRGVAQSNDFWRPIPAGLSLRSAKSYGITVKFAFLDIRRTLRKLWSGGGK